MLWLKAFHIIFVVCWFAGLFYLPRIFVYYAASEQQAVREQLAIMARKLYRFVTPFMVIAIVLGVVMIAMNPDYYLGRPLDVAEARRCRLSHCLSPYLWPLCPSDKRPPQPT